MQLIAEAYDLLKNVGGLSNAQLKETFEKWNQGELKSFLIEITAKVIDLQDPDGTGKDLVDLILDKAGQKGTGKWTTQCALDLGVPVPTITAAVDARGISSLKEERKAASTILAGPKPAKIGSAELQQFIDDVRAALYCSKICSYAQGMAMLGAADKEYKFGLRLGEIARIWKAGCIIRAVFLDEITKTYREHPDTSNLLIAGRFKEATSTRQDAWRRTLITAIKNGIATPAFSSSLAYYDSYRRERGPANLIQAQRDFFGAHTYERIDKPGSFHTEWSQQATKK
jgi:6-phosphogluconate dehydrogenase